MKAQCIPDATAGKLFHGSPLCYSGRPLAIWLTRGRTLILDELTTSVAAQLADQAKLGVQVVNQEEVPETGPSHRGLWWRIPNVTTVFADLKSSTALNSSVPPEAAAVAYTYFIRAMTLVLEKFSAGYIDIQGDGIFGLFEGKRSMFLAAACAITMRTQVEKAVATRFKRDASVKWDLKAGIGIDRGTLLVRQLGLRGMKQNEVWAGKPVNMAAKLSSAAGPNEVAVSDRVFSGYEASAKLTQRALLCSCGCSGRKHGAGLDTAASQASKLWTKQAAPKNLGLDFQTIYKRKSGWCEKHGSEYCEVAVTGRRQAG